MHRPRQRSARLLASTIAALSAVSLVAACSSDSDSADAGATGTDGPVSELAAACPARVVLQTNWYPEGEHGAAYQLAGPGGEFDPTAGSYVNEIGDTGVEFEIRAGGPFLSGQRVDSIMYQDDEILLGMLDTTTIMTGYEAAPTTSVFAPFDKALDVLMFDPATYDFDTIEDFEGTSMPILAWESGKATATFLVDEGLITPDQLDYSNDGSLSRFVVEDGKMAQLAYATNEPYRLERETEGWMKPATFFPLADMGFDNYSTTYVVTPEKLESEADCLSLLVPMLQQSALDYIEDPTETNEQLLAIVEELGSQWTMTQGHLDNTAAVIAEGEFVGNGTDETLGNFDMERVQRVVDEFTRIYTNQGVDVPSGLRAEDVATNQFIDPAIGR
jgi:hypothetical protein